MGPEIDLFFGPEWVKRATGWSRQIRLFYDNELFLDDKDFLHDWDALSYCFDNFGLGNYTVTTL